METERTAVYQVKVSCLRYVVPFEYSEDFDKAYRKVEMLNLWEKNRSYSDDQESDLYGYIRDEFRFAENKQEMSGKKMGCEWLYCSDGQPVKQLLYFPDGIRIDTTELPERWDISIAEAGLRLFRNGLGLFWYELVLPEEGVDSDKLEIFQNVVKELNRSGFVALWENTEPGGKIRPFSLGMWIQHLISFLDIQYFAERRNGYSRMMERAGNLAQNLSDKLVCEPDESSMSERMAPDKALLFNYVVFVKNDQEVSLKAKESLVYHITNGYRESYHFCNETALDMMRPFEDVFWYATKEGVTYIAWADEDNEKVFTKVIPGKIRRDYFALYLKVLYQSYSLLIYAEKIQSEISADTRSYLNEYMNQDIEKLFVEINLFLTKSMATSVSHIHNQSEFYVFLKKQLRIQEDVESVTAGLAALDTLQRKQREQEARETRAQNEDREKRRDEKTQAIMGLFALLGIFSAFLDGFDLVGKFSPGGEWSQLSGATLYVTILFITIAAIISIIAIIFAVKAIIAAFKDRDE